MVMDETVAKPETFGMRPGWSGGVMGMMTVVRVLPEEMYDKVMALVGEKKQASAGSRLTVMGGWFNGAGLGSLFCGRDNQARLFRLDRLLRTRSAKEEGRLPGR